MTLQLTRFTIEGLYGTRTLDIPIVDNRLVLVGENGSGKTTIINLFFYFLSRQWDRLISYAFQSIKLEINGNSATITYNDLRDALANEDFLIELRDMPRAEQERFFRRFRDLELRRKKIGSSAFPEKLQHVIDGNILYLPTYRRIERELTDILPRYSEVFDMEYEYRRKRLQPQSRRSPSEQVNYIELVEFGMQDVSRLLNDTTRKLKTQFAHTFNNLNQSYLSQLVEVTDIRLDTLNTLHQVDVNTVNIILGRIDNNLSTQVKNELREIYQKAVNNTDLSERERYIAYFLNNLIEIYQSQQQKEKPLQAFVEVCNRYLIDKGFVYDTQSVEVELQFKNAPAATLDLIALSSGEKQIVSLFAHLYLSEYRDFIVIVDEPELSLSIDWQRTFLPDIWQSGRCAALLAATHSPFIFDNEMDIYTHDSREFVREFTHEPAQ